MMIFGVAEPVGAASVSLAWDANTETDLAGYNLYWSTRSLLSSTTAQATASAQAAKRQLAGLATAATAAALDDLTTYYFRLTAYNASGQESGFNVNAALQPAEVSAFTPDSTLPAVAITAPANGASVSGSVNIAASASDNAGVTRVEFYVDGVLKGTDNGAPYSYGLDTTGLSNGSHALVAKAYDAAGNAGQSAQVSVVVSNASSASLKPIIFEEKWQSTPDWYSQQSQSGARVWPASFAVGEGGTCTQYCPPPGWTGYNVNNEANIPDPLRIVSDANCADPSLPSQNKCLIYNITTKGDYRTWHGGRMGKLFPKPGGYHELHIRFKIKYGPAWQWADCPGCGPGNSTGNQLSLMKMIRIARFSGNIATDNPFDTQSCGNGPNPLCKSLPIAIPDILENPYYYYADPAKYRKNVAAILSFGVDPEYHYAAYDGKNASAGGVPAPYMPEDGAWHTVEYRVKMNSAPGVKDGEFEMWLDNSADTAQTWTHYKTSDVPWLNTGAFVTSPEWNMIWIPDNMTRFYNGTEQIYYGPIIAYEPLTSNASQTDGALWAASPKDGRLPFNYFGTSVPDTAAPSAPGNVALSNPAAASLSLAWAASTDNVGVAGYRLDVSLNSAFSSFVSGYQNKDLGKVTSASLTGLSANTVYYARLRAYDAAGNTSANSASASGRTAV
ncbi:MAG TPA: hypothetical protein DEB40_09905, partial [Elusimicrobia bacterium]|nr:hypothetical protein [Elusimicrobiota bacterium]